MARFDFCKCNQDRNIIAMKRSFLLFCLIFCCFSVWGQPHIPFKIYDVFDTQEEIDKTYFSAEIYIGNPGDSFWRKDLGLWLDRFLSHREDQFEPIAFFSNYGLGSNIYKSALIVHQRTPEVIIGKSRYSDVDIFYYLRVRYKEGSAYLSISKIQYLASGKFAVLCPDMVNTEDYYDGMSKENQRMTDWVLSVISERFEDLLDSFRERFCQKDNLSL